MSNLRSIWKPLLLVLALTPATVWAQPEEAPPLAAPTEGAPGDPMVTPEAAPPAPAAPVAVVAPAPAPAPAVNPSGPWYEALSFNAFLDVYYSANVLDFKAPTNRTLRAFDVTNGFAVSWFGVDLAYAPGAALGPIGATVSLRAGPTALLVAGPGDGAINLAPLAQAYLTFKASEALSVDFGKFDTIYGAEVTQSWKNHNYTRGALFTIMQPYFHTGLRVNLALNDAVTLRGLLVNGYNNSVDNNAMKTLGLQAAYAAGPLSITLGYLLGPEQDGNNEDLKHLIDFVVGFNPTEKVSLTFNGDFVLEKRGDQTVKAFGVAASGFMQLTEVWGGGLRFEFIADPDGYLSAVPDANLITGTLTIGANLGKVVVVRWDTRLDFATEKVFAQTDGDISKAQLTSTIGVVFKTN